jgi:hypothetical protein
MVEINEKVYVWKNGTTYDVGHVVIPTETHIMIKSILSDKTAIYEKSEVWRIGTGPVMTEPEVPFDEDDNVDSYDYDINWCKQVRDYVKRGNQILKIMGRKWKEQKTH